MDNYRLLRNYQEFNKTYFNNELPDIPVKFAKLKKVAGVAKGTTNNYTGKTNPDIIKITNFFNLSEQEIKETLLHEMIHVWEMNNNIQLKGRNHHGKEFRAKAQEIMNKSNFSIKLSHDARHNQVNSSEKMLNVLIGHYYNSEKQSFIVVFQDGLLENDNHLVISRMLKADKKRKGEDFSYLGIKTNLPELQRFQIKRKVNTKQLKAYFVEDTLISELLTNGDNLFKI